MKYDSWYERIVSPDRPWLSGAGLDVFPQEPYRGPLCDSDRVILSPHQATLTIETRMAMETRAVESVVRCLRGER